MAIDGINPALLNPALNLPRAGQAAATSASAAADALAARQQGVVDRTALQTALTSTVVPTARTASDPTLVQTLDRNGNGSVTPEELVAQTQSLANQLFDNLRQSGGSQNSGNQTEQVGNPGRLMALTNLMDLVNAYGPNGRAQDVKGSIDPTLDVSA